MAGVTFFERTIAEFSYTQSKKTNRMVTNFLFKKVLGEVLFDKITEKSFRYVNSGVSKPLKNKDELNYKLCINENGRFFVKIFSRDVGRGDDVFELSPADEQLVFELVDKFTIQFMTSIEEVRVIFNRTGSTTMPEKVDMSYATTIAMMSLIANHIRRHEESFLTLQKRILISSLYNMNGISFSNFMSVVVRNDLMLLKLCGRRDISCLREDYEFFSVTGEFVKYMSNMYINKRKNIKEFECHILPPFDNVFSREARTEVVNLDE